MKSNKAIKISLAIMLSLIFFISLTFGILLIVKNSGGHNFSDALPERSKVVLFIGDGMGENHIEIAETYLGRNLCFESFTYSGYVSTSSKELFSPTDSAAAATALATGKKVNNGAVAMENGKNIISVSELAKLNGLGVGIVTTDALKGATPACFSAHANNRNDYEDIIQSQIISNIDLFLGSGYEDYLPYKSDFEAKGYTFSNSLSDLSVDCNKIFGVFSSIANEGATDKTPSLTDLVKFAADFFDKKFPNGYFLMVEGAHIDKMSHKNKIFDMIDYLGEFDRAISYARGYYANDRNAALIVTADHETGNLAKLNGTKDDINDGLFKSTDHTSQDVKYFFNLCSDNDEIVLNMPEKIDNTDIFGICINLLKLKIPAA